MPMTDSKGKKIYVNTNFVATVAGCGKHFYTNLDSYSCIGPLLLGSCKKCHSGDHYFGARCYKPCRDGYHRKGVDCTWALGCPYGFRDDGVTCWKPVQELRGKPWACVPGYTGRHIKGTCCPFDVPYPDDGGLCWRTKTMANKRFGKNLAIYIGETVASLLVTALIVATSGAVLTIFPELAEGFVALRAAAAARAGVIGAASAAAFPVTAALAAEVSAFAETVAERVAAHVAEELVPVLEEVGVVTKRAADELLKVPGFPTAAKALEAFQAGLASVTQGLQEAINEILVNARTFFGGRVMSVAEKETLLTLERAGPSTASVEPTAEKQAERTYFDGATRCKPHTSRARKHGKGTPPQRGNNN
jgi:hypothetical protein